MAIKGKQAPKIKQALGTVVDLNEWDVELVRHGTSQKGMDWAHVKITAENGLTYFGSIFGKTAKELVEDKFADNSLYFELRFEQGEQGFQMRLICDGK